jgi:alanine dehydrogenase
MLRTELAPTSMLVLTDEQVSELLTLPQLIESIDRAFRNEYDPNRSPVRSRFIEDDRIILVMPCQSENAIGIKTILLMRRQDRGPRTYRSSYTFHSLDGVTSAFIEANAMTELRTAATSAAATRALAREDADVLGIFGTGAIAQAHVAAMLHVRSFKQVLVCGSLMEKSRRFAQQIQQRHGVPASAVAAGTCAAEASVICTCTTSLEPLFSGAVLAPGTHINAVGAFTHDCREVDSLTVARSRLVIDTYGGALAEAGDLLKPIEEGSITRAHVVSDLQGALLNPSAVRRTAEDITLFKSVGCALEDMVAARMLLSPARKSNSEAGSGG